MRYISPTALVIEAHELAAMRLRIGALGMLAGFFFGALVVYLVR